MTRSLAKLIKASGGAGIAGQTFKGNVTPTQAVQDMTGFKMTDYRVTALGQATGWHPPTSMGDDPYGSSNNSAQFVDMPTLTFTVTRGAQAYRIQQVYPAGFTVSVAQDSGWGSAGVGGQLLSVTTPDSGGTLEMNFRIIPPYRGTFTHSVTRVESSPDNWYWQVQPTTTNEAGSFSVLRVFMLYNPDSAGFNPSLQVDDPYDTGSLIGVPVRVYDRVYVNANFEYRWYPGPSTTYDANNSANDSFIVSTSDIYNIQNAELGVQYVAQAWARVAGTGLTWVTAGSVVSHTYTGGGGGGGGGGAE
jgi:hypothetical protein